jgi:ADP-dependent NAD(P)H-hydrate dehydratase / NAD(P)H-hydrate epimerase
MKALTAAEMREADRLTTERYGVSSLQLMENAGTRVAEALRESLAVAGGHPAKICVLCGKGNNGGDAFVAARHLQDATAQIKLFLFGRPDELRGDAATNHHRWIEMGGQVAPIPDAAAWDSLRPEIDSAQVIVDGIFGTGFRGAATGAVAKAIEDINRISRNAAGPKPALILAVDTPSGLPADGQPAEGPVLYAHKTVTFTAPKIGQLTSTDCAAAGSLEVVNIGSPTSLVEEVGKGSLRWSEPQEFAQFPLIRTADSHKGLYGHVLVVAGSLGKPGAAVMSGYAGLCAGAGLVTIAAPDVVLPVIAAAHPEYMTEPLASTGGGTASERNLAKKRFDQIHEGKTVLAVGPGLGLHPETQDFIRAVVRQTELPVVLDADGLNAFAGNADELRERQAKFLAITPHPGEMARLLNISTKAVQQDHIRAAQEAAQRWNVHVVLKGFHTVITSPGGKLFINTSGNPGLAKGGSGDVLTGLLAALTAQFKTEDWSRVLALGVYLHGVAAEIVTHGTDSSGLLATEVARAVPKARLKLLQELQWRG